MSINKSTFSTLSWLPSIIIHVIAFLISIGFGLYHLLYDVLLIGISASLSALFCAIAIVSLIHKKPKALNYYFYYGFQFIALITTCYLYGLRGLILIYPITASLFYILSYRCAFWSAFTYYVAALLVSIPHFEPDMFFRIALALLVSVVIAAGFSYVVYRQQNLLEHEANYDYLTNILNRRGFSSRLSSQLLQIKKMAKDIAILFIDLDGFKLINDAHGHEIGDKLLAAFAGRIMGTLRLDHFSTKEDKLNSFARISGDEFAVTISGIDIEEAKNIAERLLQTCENPYNIAKNQIRINMSIGICLASQANYDAQTLLSNADTAMYKAKHSGKAKYEIYDNEQA